MDTHPGEFAAACEGIASLGALNSNLCVTGISQLPLVSPQLLACTVIWVQYLDFRFSSQQLLAFILVSVSNFPLSHLPLSHQFSAVTWLQYLHVPPFLSTPSCMHLVSISKFPPPSSGIHFRVPKIPPASLSNFLHVSSCVFISFQCLGSTPHLSTTFCAHPVSISNFPFPLCAHQFPASISLHTQTSPTGLSTASYVFIVSIPELPRHQQLLACILSQYLNSPHPVPGPKKRVRVPKKKAPRSKNIQPNVSAYNDGVSPPPYGGKVHEAGARVQKTEAELRHN